MDLAYYKTPQMVCESLDSDLEVGLTEVQVLKAKKTFGKNVLPKAKEKSFISLILEQFEDLLVIILLVAALVSFALSFLEKKTSLFEAIVEPAVILLILILNAVVGVVQESNAARAINSLKEFEPRSCSVVRAGSVVIEEATDLVPGDLVKLSVGERIPADCRLVKVITRGLLMVDESMLTGETAFKTKTIPVIEHREHLVVQDMDNILFSGSLVVKGKCLALVIKTGIQTELGKIHRQLEEIGEEKKRTPLQEKLDVFATQLSKIILVICILVWVVNIGHFTDPEHGGILLGAVYYLKIAVSLAVAAIPEGLPAVITTCLALGTKRMAKKNAIVRSLPSVETLGCTTVVCSDKTGTLTTNKMNVRNVVVIDIDEEERDKLDFRKFTVTGVDFNPTGTITDVSCSETIKDPKQNAALEMLAQIGYFCNDSSVVCSTKQGRPVFEISGMSLEAALKVFAQKLHLSVTGKRLHYFDFDRSRKLMSTIDRVERFEKSAISDVEESVCGDKEVETKRLFCHVKGAPEYVLARCNRLFSSSGQEAPLIESDRELIKAEISALASSGLRVLGFAFNTLECDCVSDKSEDSYEDGIYPHEKDLVFVGLCGLLDPPREEVAASIDRCLRSGIQVKVMTGDHQSTAESICRKIGLLDDKADLRQPLLAKTSVTGTEFMKMTEKEKKKSIEETILYSRVEPQHKLELVRLLKERGHVVAMTGDGVNDAAALRAADIGVAMGSGTQVAQQASDMVLLDDNFTTIVNAVEEGRAIYANMKQFIRYLISSNIGEVVCVFLTALLGIPEALIPVQLLWVNLVTDGLPATALGFNPVDTRIMEQKPRKRDEKIISEWLLIRYLIIGVYIGVATVFGFVWWFLFASSGPGLTLAQLRNFHSCGKGTSLFPPDFDCSIFHNKTASTISLSVLVTIEMFNAFNAISENSSLLEIPPSRNLYVVGAVALSFLLHASILYIAPLRRVFSTAPLTLSEWGLVLLLSFPVILIDEVLKSYSRRQSPESWPAWRGKSLEKKRERVNK